VNRLATSYISEHSDVLARYEAHQFRRTGSARNRLAVSARSDGRPLDGAASIDRDHDIRRLDDRVGGLTGFQTELVNSFVGDRCAEKDTVDVELDVGGGLPFGDGFDDAFDLIASAQLHRKGSFSEFSIKRGLAGTHLSLVKTAEIVLNLGLAEACAKTGRDRQVD
jgi:hypothetical protein